MLRQWTVLGASGGSGALKKKPTLNFDKTKINQFFSDITH